jgi:hypothetical protein
MAVARSTEIIAYCAEERKKFCHGARRSNLRRSRGDGMKDHISAQSDDPQVVQVLRELADAISKVIGNASELSTAVPGLTLYRNTVPTAPNPCTYVPSLLLIPQGKKRVDLGKQSYVFGESTFLLTSIDLPIVSRVCAASAEKPYLVTFSGKYFEVTSTKFYKLLPS